MVKHALAALVALAMLCSSASAQQNRTTLNYSTSITTGNTYRTLRPAKARWSITLQNNNASDAC
jgi:hypothetical protein